MTTDVLKTYHLCCRVTESFKRMLNPFLIMLANALRGKPAAYLWSNSGNPGGPNGIRTQWTLCAHGRRSATNKGFQGLASAQKRLKVPNCEGRCHKNATVN